MARQEQLVWSAASAVCPVRRKGTKTSCPGAIRKTSGSSVRGKRGQACKFAKYVFFQIFTIFNLPRCLGKRVCTILVRFIM